MSRSLIIVALFSLGAAPLSLKSQSSLEPAASTGRSVTPVFEGWFRNAVGTYSLSFGYFNRNTDEVVHVPLGAANALSSGGAVQGQPDTFFPRRHFGVFAVRVPADFGKQKVVWTLSVRGETFAIPGSLHTDWEIDALAGEAGSGNTPPSLRFAADGAVAQGPGGYAAGPLSAQAGVPLPIAVWVTDDGKGASSVVGLRGVNAPVTLTWFPHQGPGEVSFSVPTEQVTGKGGEGKTSVTFSKPGNYIVRVRANDASGVVAAGHSQCCWTNGFVRVTVR